MNWVIAFVAFAFLFINCVGLAKYWQAGRAGWAGVFAASLISNVIFISGLSS